MARSRYGTLRRCDGAHGHVSVAHAVPGPRGARLGADLLVFAGLRSRIVRNPRLRGAPTEVQVHYASPPTARSRKTRLHSPLCSERTGKLCSRATRTPPNGGVLR